MIVLRRSLTRIKAMCEVKEIYIHPKAIVETKKIGKHTRIWAFSHILEGAEIGENCNICDHIFIEGNVIVGNNVKIKSGGLFMVWLEGRGQCFHRTERYFY